MIPRTISRISIPAPRSKIILDSSAQCRRQLHIQRSTFRSNTNYYGYLSQARLRNDTPPPASYSSLYHLQFVCRASTAAAEKSTLAPSPQKTKPHITASTKLSITPSPAREASEKLNPPRETYAPELKVPEQQPGQGKLKWLYHAGRAYIAFYKSGINNVRSTAAIAKQLRQKVQEVNTQSNGNDILTRAEWQIIRRSKADMLRLPIFGALVLLLGEWLPLIVMYITPVIPEPCRIPSQTTRTLKKLEQRRKERERRLGMDAARLLYGTRKPGVPTSVNDVPAPNAVKPEDLQKLHLFGLLTLSSKLDAHSKLWDLSLLTPPKAVLRWGLKRRLQYLQKDDELIMRDGGWQGLSKEEGIKACMERGIDVIGRNDKDLRGDLKAWFEKR